MKPEHIIIALVILYAVEVVRHTLNQRRWDNERRDLLARVQAGSLDTYTRHRQVEQASSTPATQPGKTATPAVPEPVEEIDLVMVQEGTQFLRGV